MYKNLNAVRQCNVQKYMHDQAFRQTEAQRKTVRKMDAHSRGRHRCRKTHIQEDVQEDMKTGHNRENDTYRKGYRKTWIDMMINT